VTQHRKVVVLGSTVVTELFGRGANPVGETVKFGGINFRVLGVLRDFGGFEDQNNLVVAPLTTVQDALTGNTGTFSALTVQAASRERTDAAFVSLRCTTRRTAGIRRKPARHLRVVDRAAPHPRRSP
jgi:putative ABC transport system permease protein